MMSQEAKEVRRKYYHELNQKMTPEQRERKNAYRREWYRRNREYCKAYMENYWERRAAAARPSSESAGRGIR